MAKEKNSMFEKLVPVLLIASIGLAFAVGVLWQKVNVMQGGGTVNQQVPSGNAAQPAAAPNGKLTQEQVKNVAKVSADDHIKGNLDAKVFLIEYSDYQCPYCEAFHSTAQQVVDEYGDQVAWIYRHFPLDQIHPNARPAANAAECIAALAGEDAFWKFTDAVFADQDSTLADIEGTAVAAGVNAASFSDCYDSEKYADEVENDYQSGITAGITGTPGNIIFNTKGDAWLIPGALPFAQIKTTIDEALGN